MTAAGFDRQPADDPSGTCSRFAILLVVVVVRLAAGQHRIVESVASKHISNGELISTATHVRYLVTRRHQMGSLLAQIAEMKKSSLTQQKR